MSVYRDRRGLAGGCPGPCPLSGHGRGMAGSRQGDWATQSTGTETETAGYEEEGNGWRLTYQQVRTFPGKLFIHHRRIA